jgi:hypothetical protein
VGEYACSTPPAVPSSSTPVDLSPVNELVAKWTASIVCLSHPSPGTPELDQVSFEEFPAIGFREFFQVIEKLNEKPDRKTPLAVLATLVVHKVPTVIVGADSGATVLASASFGDSRHQITCCSPFLDGTSTAVEQAFAHLNWMKSPYFLFMLEPASYFTSIHRYLNTMHTPGDGGHHFTNRPGRVHIQATPETGVDVKGAVASLNSISKHLDAGSLVSVYGLSREDRKEFLEHADAMFENCSLVVNRDGDGWGSGFLMLQV